MLISGASNGQHLQFAHQWFGVGLFLIAMLQGPLGWFHHRRYVRDKPERRRWYTHVHIWLGRILIFFALINIGLGLQLYGEGAAILAVWYIFTIVGVGLYAFFCWRGFVRRKKLQDASDPPPSEGPPPNITEERPYSTYTYVNDNVGMPSPEPLGYGEEMPRSTYAPSNAPAVSNNDQSRQSRQYFDTFETGFNDYARTVIAPSLAGNRPETATPPPITTQLFRRPTSARPLSLINRLSSSAGGPNGLRQYDPQRMPEPYRTTGQPLSPIQDSFQEPIQPYRSGRSATPYPPKSYPMTPYPDSADGHEEIPSGRAPAYSPDTYFV
jgi:hypothetical protein